MGKSRDRGLSLVTKYLGKRSETVSWRIPFRRRYELFFSIHRFAATNRVVFQANNIPLQRVRISRHTRIATTLLHQSLSHPWRCSDLVSSDLTKHVYTLDGHNRSQHSPPTTQEMFQTTKTVSAFPHSDDPSLQNIGESSDASIFRPFLSIM
jgi:hypothetical protein